MAAVVSDIPPSYSISWSDISVYSSSFVGSFMLLISLPPHVCICILRQKTVFSGRIRLFVVPVPNPDDPVRNGTDRDPGIVSGTAVQVSVSLTALHHIVLSHILLSFLIGHVVEVGLLGLIDGKGLNPPRDHLGGHHPHHGGHTAVHHLSRHRDLRCGEDHALDGGRELPSVIFHFLIRHNDVVFIGHFQSIGRHFFSSYPC